MFSDGEVRSVYTVRWSSKRKKAALALAEERGFGRAERIRTSDLTVPNEEK
jgi:hypothetical protein